MNESWLNQVLKSNIKLKEKKRLLLTQMGYLRINIFQEYYERVKLSQEKNQLNEAVELMNRHAEIASIFISTKIWLVQLFHAPRKRARIMPVMLEGLLELLSPQQQDQDLNLEWSKITIG